LITALTAADNNNRIQLDERRKRIYEGRGSMKEEHL